MLLEGPARELPAPTREVITEALAALDGGPVAVGPLAFAVCNVMGVDTSGITGSYRLRTLMSWSKLLAELKRMTADGLLVVRTQREWRDMSAGALFTGIGSGTTQAYATASVAGTVDAAHRVRLQGAARGREEFARRTAQARVLVENRTLVEKYMNEWLAANPPPERGSQ